jgi:SAM-dependent methyltransferase
MTESAGQLDFAPLRWALVDDVLDPTLRGWFEKLEPLHRRFGDVNRALRNPPYPWPLMPLYAWSRRVEYPFVMASLAGGGRVLDAGSGVTFLPLALQEFLQCEVECLDTDPTFGERYALCARELSAAAPRFHVGNLCEKLALPDASFDAVLCVSVLEHLPPARRFAAWRELWRLVKPGGRLIVTLDVALEPRAEGLRCEEIPALARELQSLSGQACEIASTPPENALTTRQPGYGLLPLDVSRSRKLRIMPESGWGRLYGRLRWKVNRLPELGCLLSVLHRP